MLASNREGIKTYFKTIWVKTPTDWLIQLIKFVDLLSCIHIPENTVRQNQFISWIKSGYVVVVLIWKFRSKDNNLLFGLNIINLQQ